MHILLILLGMALVAAIFFAWEWRIERKKRKRLERMKNAPPYVFGSSAPTGSAHLPGRTFDCSELVEWHKEKMPPLRLEADIWSTKGEPVGHVYPNVTEAGLRAEFQRFNRETADKLVDDAEAAAWGEIDRFLKRLADDAD